MKLKDLVSQEDLAKELNIDTRVLVKWRGEGLTYHRIGRRVYYLESEVMDFIVKEIRDN